MQCSRLVLALHSDLGASSIHLLPMKLPCWPHRDLDKEDDLLFGVHDEMLYARNSPPVQGAQWTGIVTQIAIDMLDAGTVDAVVCVQSQDGDRFAPKPVIWHGRLREMGLLCRQPVFNQCQ